MTFRSKPAVIPALPTRPCPSRVDARHCRISPAPTGGLLPAGDVINAAFFFPTVGAMAALIDGPAKP